MTFFSRALRLGIFAAALSMLNCQQLMDLLDPKNKVDESASTTNTDLDKAGSWTILVYLDAANNLEGAGVDDVGEMYQNAGNYGGNKVYVLMDRISGYSGIDLSAATNGGPPNAFGNFPDAKLFEIINGTGAQLVTTVNGYTNLMNTYTTAQGEVNMGAQQTLTDFLTWGYKQAKLNGSDYIFVDIWDHGAGWGGAAYGGNAVAWDDEASHDALTIQEIRSAMSAAETASGMKATILGFDACYMGTIENAFSFKDNASIMIGSEEVEPGAGWQYKNWTPKGKVSPRTVASNVVNTFKASYSNSGEQVTLAAIDLSKLSGISYALDSFVVKLAQQSPTLISNARLQAQSYNNDMSVDLFDFADKIGIPEAATLKNMITSSLVAEAHTAGGKVNGSHGMTIYFPQSKDSYDTQYDATVFAQSTRWDDFVSGKVITIEVATTEPSDVTCGLESHQTLGTSFANNDTPKAANWLTGTLSGCGGYIFTPSDVDAYRFNGTWSDGSAKTITVTLSNIPAGADYDVLLFNLDVSPSGPVASGSIASGNGDEKFVFTMNTGAVNYPNQGISCDPVTTPQYVSQGLCYGQGMASASNALGSSSDKFFIVVVGKNNSYNSVSKYSLSLSVTTTTGTFTVSAPTQQL